MMKPNDKAEHFPRIRGNFIYPDSLGHQHIRLLRIKTAQGDEIVEISLTNYSVSSAPEYIVLSYAQEDSGRTSTIICEGRALTVDTSLEEALQELRHNQSILAEQFYGEKSCHEPLYYWCSNICINRSDTNERTQQTRRLWKTLCGAESLIVCLGINDRRLEMDFDLATKLKASSENMDGGGGYSKTSGDGLKSTSHELSRHDLPDMMSIDWFCLTRILKVKYFQQLWAIPELAAAQHKCLLITQSRTLAFTTLLEVGSMIDRIMPRNWKSTNASSFVLEVYEQYEKRKAFLDLLDNVRPNKRKKDLPELLWMTRHLETSADVERIFALLPVARGITSQHLELIDYSTNIQETLLNVANLCLDQGPTNLIAHAQAFGHLSDLPSWIPTWQNHYGSFHKNDGTLACKPDTAFSRHSHRPYIPLVHATPRLVHHVEELEYHVNADKTLVLKGKIIDTLKTLIVPPEGHSVFFETLLDTDHKFEMNIRVLETRYKQFESFVNFHKRCLVQLRGLMGLPNDADPFGVHWRLCFMDDTADLPIRVRNLTLQCAQIIKLNMACIKDTIRLVKLESLKGFQATFRLLHYYTLDASLKRRYKTIENFKHKSGEVFLSKMPTWYRPDTMSQDHGLGIGQGVDPMCHYYSQLY